ncbi:MAG: hypothetical protein HY791_39900 [Deltaproteobacteria bacterium]|nr:hypothetical protein [Deltaproteobacteria bacterium]
MNSTLSKRLVISGALAVILGTWSLALLYLSVPNSTSPFFGVARRVVEIAVQTLPYPTLRLEPHEFTAAASAALGLMWTGYLVVLVAVGRGDAPDSRFLVRALALAAVLRLGLLVLPSGLSKDALLYAGYGRMIVVHHANPYTVQPGQFGDDPIIALGGWLELTSHYGPVFLWLSALLAWLGQGHVLLTSLIFRAAATACDGAICLLIYRLAKDRGEDGSRGLLLYALNPLIALEIAGSGHNEPFMMLSCLLGLFLLRRGHPLSGHFAIMGSIAVKYITASVAVLALVRHLADLKTGGARAKLLIQLALFATAAAAVLFAGLWGGTDTFSGVTSAVVDGQLIQSSGARAGARPFALIGFAVAVVAATLAMVKLDWSWIYTLSAGLCLSFVVFVFHWKFPWYFIPAMTLALAGPPTRPNRVIFLTALSLGALSSFFYALLIPINRG